MKKLYFLLLTILISAVSLAQTTLTAGDIVIIGLKSDATKEFKFVPLVDLAMGTEIYFTDSGWVATTSSFRNSEGAIKYTAPSLISVGTIITFYGTTSGTGTLSNSNPDFTNANSSDVGTNGFNLSTSGDQILAFQGSAASPTFIFAVSSVSNNWATDATSSNNSAVPAGLTNGVNCVTYGSGPNDGDEYDNIWYTGSLLGTKAVILAAVANASNWTGDDVNYTLSTPKNQIAGFSMYPNPTSLGYVTISSKSNSNLEVTVFDVLGKQVIKETVISDNVLNVSRLKSGMYITKVSQDDATTTQKLVVR